LIVIDASIVVTACLAEDEFSALERERLVAPPLMWSEARSVLHELVWRGEVSLEDGRLARDALARAPVERRDDDRVGAESWRVADALGWAKTYDAEYVALAGLLGCLLVTLDARLRRSADRIGFVVSPSELD
jgi:predicted nucleic acid-binding protein